MAGDRGACVLRAGRVQRIEALLRVDERQPCGAGRRIERLVGVDVGAEIRQDQRVVVDRGLVVDFRRFADRGAAAEGGEGEEGERGVGREDRECGGVLADKPQARAREDATAVRGAAVRVCGITAEPRPRQCAMGHEPPSLVSLRSGSVSQAEEFPI